MLALLLVMTPGCVTRKLFIVSDPPGARVMLDNAAVGSTPYEEEFISYGVRRIELELPGFETQSSTVAVVRPWWQTFPIDMLTDLIWPFEIRNEQTFSFVLEPRSGAPGTWDDAREAYRRMRERMQDLQFRETGDTEP